VEVTYTKEVFPVIQPINIRGTYVEIAIHGVGGTNLF
jgi:hypothetical protein